MRKFFFLFVRPPLTKGDGHVQKGRPEIKRYCLFPPLPLSLAAYECPTLFLNATVLFSLVL